MNIFVLDNDPVAAAAAHCDRHVVKMILESAQMLSTAVWACSRERGTPIDPPYRVTHDRHPCTLWVRESRANFRWLTQLAFELGREHLRRFNPRSEHKSLSVVAWCMDHREVIPDTPRTAFVQCMPKQYQGADAVKAYRAYYMNEKRAIAQWRPPAKVPAWWK